MISKSGSQARVPETVAKQGSQEQVPKVPRTVPQVPKQEFQEQVCLQGSKVTKQGPWEQVPKNWFRFQEQILQEGSEQ